MIVKPGCYLKLQVDPSGVGLDGVTRLIAKSMRLSRHQEPQAKLQWPGNLQNVLLAITGFIQGSTKPEVWRRFNPYWAPR